MKKHFIVLVLLCATRGIAFEKGTADEKELLSPLELEGQPTNKQNNNQQELKEYDGYYFHNNISIDNDCCAQCERCCAKPCCVACKDRCIPCCGSRGEHVSFWVFMAVMCIGGSAFVAILHNNLNS